MNDSTDIEALRRDFATVAVLIPLNSGRVFEREARLQDITNRQASHETEDKDLQFWWLGEQQAIARHAASIYEQALKRGMAKEVARNVLPEGLTESVLYMAGTIRSFIHYCQLRCEAGTQKEHREVALAIRGVLLEQFPALAEVCSG